MNRSDYYETFGHGGDYTGEFLDFSVNVSPLGVPDSVRSALRDLDEGNALSAYPDPFCCDLRETIARKEGLSAEQVVCGNGAVELVYRLVRALRPKKSLIVEPTFSEYEAALREVDCQVEKYYVREVLNEFGKLCAQSFTLTGDLLNELPEDLDLLFLCSPNNPTGRSVDEALMKEILETCRARGIRVVWDACFLDFMDLEDGADRQEKAEQFLLSCVREYEGLIALKSLTKTYALAGLRIGYVLCSDTELVDTLLTTGVPWSVSTPAQVAGIAALQDDAYLERTRRYVSEEKLQLWLGLLQMGRSFCRRGDGNYLLLWTELPDLAERLKKRGILVRDCSNFDGLDEHYIRIAIRTRRDNQKLYEALWEELKGGETDG